MSDSQVPDNNSKNEPFTVSAPPPSFDGINKVVSIDGTLTDEGPVGASIRAIPTLAFDINAIITAGNNTIRMRVDNGALRTIALPPLAETDPVDFAGLGHRSVAPGKAWKRGKHVDMK